MGAGGKGWSRKIGPWWPQPEGSGACKAEPAFWMSEATKVNLSSLRHPVTCCDMLFIPTWPTWMSIKKKICSTGLGGGLSWDPNPPKMTKITVRVWKDSIGFNCRVPSSGTFPYQHNLKLKLNLSSPCENVVSFPSMMCHCDIIIIIIIIIALKRHGELSFHSFWQLG